MQSITDMTELEDDALTLAGPDWRARVGDFVELTKPRMNFLVLITTGVGYFMAARDADDWRRLLATLLGTALAAAAASVLNQYSERDFDALMSRTRNRPLPAGRIAPLEALLLGVALAVTGLGILRIFVNPLTALLGALTVASYVFLYTPMKRWTSLCTLVGAVPGALPIVMGWTAVRGRIEPEALALFAILFFWQMPHFLAIAILYRDDYALGGFRMLPVVDRELNVTGRQIVLYALALVPVSLLPAQFHFAGPLYFVAAVIFGVAFASFGVLCAWTKSRREARQLFFASIVYLPFLLASMMLDKL